MADEKKQASLSPFPGGDAGILLISLGLTTALAGLSVIAVYAFVPEAERATVTTVIVGFYAPTLTGMVAALKSHANGNALQDVKERADAAAAEATTAKNVAAVTRQELKANTAATVETQEAVKRLAGDGSVELHGPRRSPSGGDIHAGG